MVDLGFEHADNPDLAWQRNPQADVLLNARFKEIKDGHAASAKIDKKFAKDYEKLRKVS
jgi:hypothetical protein